MDALIRGNSFAPYPSTGRRQELEQQVEREGIESVLCQLRKVDPDSAARLHPSDRKRIIRAMEVYLETGQTITEHNRRTQLLPPRYDPVWFGLDDEDRQQLYSRIDRRVIQMLEQGLIDEIRGLLADGIPENATSMQAIGYKEFVDAVMGRSDFETATSQVQRSSRHYAKRQLTWFRRNKEIHWLTVPKDPDFTEILSAACRIVEER